MFTNPTSKAEGLEKLFGSSKVRPLKPLLNELRAFKSDAEISNMRKAGQASGRSFTEAMRHSWTKEKDLAAFVEYQFKRYDCDGSAYVPVVAGGQVCLSLPKQFLILTAEECKHDSLCTE